ncbi:MAG: DUF4177 domain-containing protein [Rhodovulum sp.]|jgi:hypothetical protein|nr:DUF4177 domain-containing protein [Rhodovulum sp.]MCI5084813.1 DUF4177 domain-containing protein [Rhodovulum sp.]|tara:strand:+ start:2154 stop:2525 length:372 start_codon:yes stop_codon:yes gene_type:complete
MHVNYEYKVVPAPHRGERAKGVKGTEARFALSLGNTINAQAAEGWEYVRAETLPCEERSGLTGKTTTFMNMLVFRRAVEVAAPVEVPVETPVVVSDDAETVEEPVMNGSADTETPAETDRASA